MSNAHLFCTHLKNYKTKTGDDFFSSTACIPFDIYIYIYIYIYKYLEIYPKNLYITNHAMDKVGVKLY